MSTKKIHNRPELKDTRKDLRNLGTSAEATLWLRLKGRQLDGRKFRRQHSIGGYVVDFYCPVEKLVVELDGEVHFDEGRIAYDEKRERFIASHGIRVVRFENKEVFENVEGVLERIREKFVTE